VVFAGPQLSSGTEGGLVPKRIHVVGAVITEGDRIMCAQRGPEGKLPGLWEFPGGKVEPGESQQEALKREIAEELGCLIEVGNEVTTTTHSYEFGEVTLTTFYCILRDGTPTLSEHVSLKWMKPSELDALSWAPADVPAVALIQAELG
jgi:8-oxo-dGTP diphosphatase